MKKFEEYRDELNKCSKCGLCETVCPLFKLNPNDCVASKGKFIMLHGISKGDLQMSANVNKYIDMCLKCGKCKAFCPASIDVCEILASAKSEYMQGKLWGKIITFLESPLVFDNAIKFMNKISRPLRNKKFTDSESSQNILYFKGCVNNIFPQNDIAISKIFKDCLVNIIEPDFKCCGIPFLSEGNIERYNEVERFNLNEISKYDAEYLVTDCASCQSTIQNYNMPAQNQIKIVNWGDIIAMKNLKFHFAKKIRVTFHKPCHLDNDDFFERIINNCSNVDYVKMNNYDDCCGFAGTFALKNPKLAIELSKQKISNIKSTGVDLVITTCPLCQLGLNIGLVNSKIKAVSLLDFLANAKIIS